MNTDLAKALYDRRKARELTLVQLSELSGVSMTHIARIERMERFPSGGILRKLAEPLGFSEIELLKLAGYLSQDEKDGRIDKLKLEVKLELSRVLMELLKNIDNF